MLTSILTKKVTLLFIRDQVRDLLKEDQTENFSDFFRTSTSYLGTSHLWYEKTWYNSSLILPSSSGSMLIWPRSKWIHSGSSSLPRTPHEEKVTGSIPWGRHPKFATSYGLDRFSSKRLNHLIGIVLLCWYRKNSDWWFLFRHQWSTSSSRVFKTVVSLSVKVKNWTNNSKQIVLVFFLKLYVKIYLLYSIAI